MAKENVQKFFEKFLSDDELQQQLKGKTADDVVAIADSLGFAFTKEELESFNKTLGGGTRELSPEELSEASGGYIVDRGFWSYYWIVDDWSGKIIGEQFFKCEAETVAENRNMVSQVISEEQFWKWREMKKEGKGPFSKADKILKR